MSKVSERWKGLRIYSQNVYRKYDWVQALLTDRNNPYDIFFFQEPPWLHLRNVASMVYWEGTPVKGMPSHPDYICLYQVKSNSMSHSTRMNLDHVSLLMFIRISFPRGTVA